MPTSAAAARMVPKVGAMAKASKPISVIPMPTAREYGWGHRSASTSAFPESSSKLSRRGCEAAGDVVLNVGVEQFLQAAADRAGGGNSVAGNLTGADEIAIRGGNENLVRGVDVLGAERLFDHGYAGFGRDFHQDAAGDAFEAAGVEWGREDLAVLDRENVRGSAFGNFAAFVEHDDFVETFFVRFRDGPDIIEPRDAFYARERRSRMAAVVAEREADDFTVLGERRGVNNQVDRWA